MLSFIKKLLGKDQLDYTDLLHRQVLILDVRTPREFRRGHADLSQNIPLQELNNALAELKKENRPIVTCCKSGLRSANAAAILRAAGLEVYNGGSWKRVQQALS